MSIDAMFEHEDRVPFDGPHGGLALVFDPTSFVPGYDAEAWPRADVAFRASGLRGAVSVHFFPWALSKFLRVLTEAHRNLSGQATLESEDGDFRLTVTFGHSGDVTLTGHLQPDVLNDTRLIFEVATDQSYVSATLVALRGLVPNA